MIAAFIFERGIDFTADWAGVGAAGMEMAGWRGEDGGGDLAFEQFVPAALGGVGNRHGIEQRLAVGMWRAPR